MKRFIANLFEPKADEPEAAPVRLPQLTVSQKAWATSIYWFMA